jgi:hypothetical protein
MIKNMNITRRKRGGDINPNNIFKKILSIGYELETSLLAKLSMIENSEDGEPILFNTDSLTKDYEIIKRIQNNDYTNEEYEYYANRVEEFVETELYTTASLNQRRIKIGHIEVSDVNFRGHNLEDAKRDVPFQNFDGLNKKNKLIEYPDSTFLVSNDLSETSFIKYLKSICNLNDNNDDGEDLIDKNDLYTFDTENGEKYKINFETWQHKHCGMFSDVEWIFTYYNPILSKNIILDTFINVAKNLILHLNSLEKQKGNLVVNFFENDKEIVKMPVNRILYNLPNTNLYYLQTHYINEELDIDDICFVPQMTFSCRNKDLIDILKELTKDNIKIFENNVRLSNDRMQIIERIENCINNLFQNYNKSVSDEHKIKEYKNKNLVKSMKNYIFMILFKLDRYFNNYLQDEKVISKSKTAKYLKDTLFYNSRHTNYELYKSLKQTVSEYFSGSLNNNDIVLIIQRLIIQQSVLDKFLITDLKHVRKNAFSITNRLDKQNKHYGDPFFSLVSYFDFFEDPIDNPERYDVNDQPFNDWLQYSAVDIYSSTSEIKNDIVLVEMRSFSRTLISYIYNFSYELNDNMTNGICNRITRKSQPDASGGISVRTLKQFISIYDNIQQINQSTIKTARSARKTMKKTPTNSKN